MSFTEEQRDIVCSLAATGAIGLWFGCVAMAIAWVMHTSVIFRDTVMAWALSSDAFLARVLSCRLCLSIQLTMLMLTITCVFVGLGMSSWLVMMGTALVVIVACDMLWGHYILSSNK